MNLETKLKFSGLDLSPTQIEAVKEISLSQGPDYKDWFEDCLIRALKPPFEGDMVHLCSRGWAPEWKPTARIGKP